ncbi:MAG: CHAT domain-containing protein [Myxococcota bacterium]
MASETRRNTSVRRARRAANCSSVVVLLSTLMMLGCGGSTSEEPPQPLVVEVGGCAHQNADDTCELTLDDRAPITIWTAEAATLHLDGEAVSAEGTAVADGVQVQVAVPPGSHQLRVARGRSSTTLQLRDDTYPAALREIQTLRSERKLDEAEAKLRELNGQAQGDLQRGRIAALAGRLAFSRGMAEDAAGHYEASIPQLLAAGRTSEAASDSFALFYALSERLQRFGDARGVLDRIEPALSTYPEGRAWLAYYRASAAMRVGELGNALTELEDAHLRADRIGAASLRQTSFELQAWIEGLLGHHQLAAASAERSLEGRGGTPCDQARRLSNLGWQRLMALEAGAGAEDPHEPLRRALALADGPCPNSLTSQILVNLAQSSLLAGNPSRAEEEITRARELGDGDTLVRVHALDVQGRTLLEQGDAEAALRVYDELSARIRVAGATFPQGQLGRGLALRALGRTDDAIDALRAADAEIDAQMVQVPLGLGRDTFSLGRGEASRALTNALLDANQAERALQTARHARARMLWSLPRFSALEGTLEESDRRVREAGLERYWALRSEIQRDAERAWLLPADEVAREAEAREVRRRQLQEVLSEALPGVIPRVGERPVAAGELLLMFFPQEEETLLFAKSRDELTTLRLGAASSEWLAPLAGRIDAASRITVIAPEDGPAASAHLLPHRGAPLAAHAPVTFALDQTSPGTARRDGTQLFVVDPRNDLPGATEEGTWLREHVANATWLRGTAATHEALVEALGAASSFHFAGHASFERERWWDSGLLLARNTTLSIGDVLAMDRVPEEVVLAGCETASSGGQGLVASIGLAQAFVLRGSAFAVATTERVNDEVTAAFVRNFYGDLNEPVAERFQRAVLALREDDLRWEPFRLIVP